MKTFASEYNEQTSFLNSKNNICLSYFLIQFYKLEKDDDELSVSDLTIETIEGYEEESNDKIYRILTLTDIHQALNTLEIKQKSTRKRRTSSTSNTLSPMPPEQSK
jgi:hypothetical protein